MSAHMRLFRLEAATQSVNTYEPVYVIFSTHLDSKMVQSQTLQLSMTAGSDGRLIYQGSSQIILEQLHCQLL